MSDSNKSGKILLVGDVMIGRSFNQIFAEDSQNLVKIWSNCLPIMQSHATVIGNLETTLTDSNQKWPNKAFNYKLSPEWAATLSIANFGLMSIANNHILDFQTTGLMETQEILDQLGIGWAGAGLNLSEAQEPVFMELPIKNRNNNKDNNNMTITLGLLSAADHYHYWEASPNQPGIWYVPILDLGKKFYQSHYWQDLQRIIKQTKKECDYLIFSLHWGPNWVEEVDPSFKLLAHRLIDIGVDIVHGHSAHHILPIERYKNGIIFYSMGDFIDDYAIDPKYRNDLGFMASIDLTNDLAVEIYPTQIKNYQVNIRK